MYTALATKDNRNLHVSNKEMPNHRRRIIQELKDLGMTRVGLLHGASRYLPSIVHADEHIGGLVYGQNLDGFVILVATDRRIIYLDKKPLFVNEDEVTYDVVSGINYSHAGWGSTVVLHTRVKDFKIRTFNERCANNFSEYIELRCLEQLNHEGHHDTVTR